MEKPSFMKFVVAEVSVMRKFLLWARVCLTIYLLAGMASLLPQLSKQVKMCGPCPAVYSYVKEHCEFNHNYGLMPLKTMFMFFSFN